MQTFPNYGKAKSIYPAASAETKGVLESIFGQKFFLPIQDRVKTLADACEITGEDPNDPYFHVGNPQDCAGHRIKTQIKALCSEHPKRTYKDPNQEKWYAVFKWDGAGFRFDAAYDDYTHSLAGAGSGLCLPNAELTKYHAVQFEEDWNIFMAEV